MKQMESEQFELIATEMLPQYDFSQGFRGKYYRACRQDYSVTIHHPDGTTTVQHFRLNPSLEEVDREPDR